MAENWYVVLELEFDPNPVTDERMIEQRIEEKRKFWSSKANDFNHGALYRRYSQMLPDIKKDMLGERNIRAELIKDACKKIYGPIDKILKQINKPEIPSDTIEKIAKKQKVEINVVKQRATVLGIHIGNTEGGDAQDTYEKYYKTKPQNADKFNGLKQMLSTFDVDNLYDFLYAGTSIKNASNQPCDALRQRAKEKKSKEFYKNDSISGTGSKICGQCDETFKEDSSKQIYDKYLEYAKRKNILESAKEIYDMTGEISYNTYKGYIAQLTEVLKDRNLAEKVFNTYCKIEKIPLAMSNDVIENQNVKICRCGCINDISDGRKVCQNCGLELQIKCPKCGTVNDASINVCRCGYKFENIDKAVALCELAEEAIENMDLNVAKAHLSDANKYWPGNDKVTVLKNRLDELENRVGNAVDVMRIACNKKDYYAAQRNYENIKRFAPEFSDKELEEEIKVAIQIAEKYKKRAETSSNENDIVEACMKAFEACNDYPGVKEIIARYPPHEPSNLSVISDPVAQVNVLSWNKSNTNGFLYYSVVRKEGAIPISVQDGKLVGRVSMCSIHDKDILSGIQYFYAIFAERAGVYSKPLVLNETVRNFFEISDVTVVAGDGSLQFTWDKIAENASVQIERNDNGKETKLECNNRISYVDKELSNDKEYHYRIYLKYTFGVNSIYTKGIELSAIPTRLPMAIEKLIVKPLQNNDYQIEWENPEDNEVQFYYSSQKPEFSSGDIVPVSNLQKNMSSLVVNKNGPTSGVFSHASDELIYIVSAAIKSGSAVVGTVARASKGGAVKINAINLVNGKILIKADLPEGASGFVVLYRDDQFPEDISDVKTVRKYIPLKQYEFDSGLLIDSNEPQNYYFSVFAEFKIDGDKNYSLGSDYLFVNISKEVITYSVEVNKKLFGPRILTLTFKSDKEQFILPAIDIMSSIGAAPMFKKSAKMFDQIEKQEVIGSVQLKIQLDKLIPRETYIKAFLNDENLQGRYQLKLKLKSELKIS